MGGVTIATARTQAQAPAQFGIKAVKTGIASTSRSFCVQVHRSPSLPRNLRKHKSGVITKAENGSQKCQTSPPLTVCDLLSLPPPSTEGFSSSPGTKGGSKRKRLKAVPFEKNSTSTTPSATATEQGLDYGEAKATLEHIYNDLTASASASVLNTCSRLVKSKINKRRIRKRKPISVGSELGTSSISIKSKKVGKGELKSKRTFNGNAKTFTCVITSTRERERKKRLSLDLRIALKKAKIERSQCKNQTLTPTLTSVGICNEEPDFWSKEVDDLIKSYTMSVGPMSLDWTRLRVRTLLSHAQHIWLAKLMKPMKFYLKTKESMTNLLGREPRDDEIASALKVSLCTFKRHIAAGQAARNKLIQHNLRLVLFEVYKHSMEGSALSFQDACQEGTEGLVVAVERFEPSKGFRLSTYAMYWIRHFILRALTVSALLRPPFAFAGLKVEMQRARLELLVELGRAPTDEEIRAKMGLNKQRYNDILRSYPKVLSLDRYSDDVVDLHDADHQAISPQALLRLGLDDLLDSLKPKESLVIRQRFGLDGKGKRSLGEVARNMNISREMVRKYEVKAMLKLKHPSRKEYLRDFLAQ